MKVAEEFDSILDYFRIYKCVLGMQKCEESTQTKIWLRYLCKVAANLVGC